MKDNILSYLWLSLFSFLGASLIFSNFLSDGSGAFLWYVLFGTFVAAKYLPLLLMRDFFPAGEKGFKANLYSSMKFSLLGAVFWLAFLFLLEADHAVKAIPLLECPFFFILFLIYLSWYQDEQNESQKKKVLIVGAGDSASRLIREIHSKPELRLHVVGLIDDNPNLAGMEILGLPVLGTRRHIPRVSGEHGIEKILIAIPSASEKQMKEIVRYCIESGIHYQTVPAEDELINDEVNLGVIRDVSLEDLLFRKAVEIDGGEIEKSIRGKRVMVTGAGGSIGSELCRQVMRYSPENLVLFERNEANLHDLEFALKREFAHDSFVSVIGDVTSESDVEKVFKTYRPSMVYHAAAYKHVPMMEQNVCQAVKNNVIGTRTLLLGARKHGVGRFVNISTDKVVNPTSVMGISKRVAELIVKELSRDSETRVMTVRFGNVLGSRGSVVPIFKEQIRKGGPVTVTHPDVTRYFMTIREAAQLVMQAGTMGSGGEIFILEMEKPIKILKIAESLISLSGRDDIEIQFTGLRPGEKMVEELWAAGEEKKPTISGNILSAGCNGNKPAPGLEGTVEELIKNVTEQNEREVISLLLKIVPEGKLELK